MKNIIRVGDKVKIVKPELFIRCGYPMTIMDVLTEMWDKYDKDVEEFINRVMSKSTGKLELLGPHREKYSICENKFQYAIAYTLLSQVHHFGGNERKLYTFDNSYYQDNVGEVVSIKYVQTGLRIPEGIRHYYDGEEDYAPAYLSEVKVHKILSTKLGERGVTIKIEAINVEKI